jgi:hypothetical protein
MTDLSYSLHERKSIMPMAATERKKKSVYGVHPGVAMTQKWIAELKKKPGAHWTSGFVT